MIIIFGNSCFPTLFFCSKISPYVNAPPLTRERAGDGVEEPPVDAPRGRGLGGGGRIGRGRPEVGGHQPQDHHHVDHDHKLKEPRGKKILDHPIHQTS